MGYFLLMLGRAAVIVTTPFAMWWIGHVDGWWEYYGW